MVDKEFIKNSYEKILSQLNGKAKLLAVSKYQSVEKIKYLSSLGQVNFGENYFQELEQKALELPNLNWHFIGTLQSNKIKKIVKYANVIESVERIEHLEKISLCAIKQNKQIKTFLQINIDDDPNKGGFGASENEEVLNCINYSKSLKNIKVVGLMCLPAKYADPKQSFIKMQQLFDRVNSPLSTEDKLLELSMGMSADYNVALEYGSTEIRVGSALFGDRVKS
ncbi:YggS family pyridoxal phosphate-dependent enzyme [Allofrancisella guangzhouensis]|uniref:Pyridoxal phosphate homeostasis protein n=1 Tax=Allofrancisella guangzhouensis TaxID=594679 RepID=A0A0A8E4B1_9GAMM|nr:YggS family pyridoxal phosphate-dependent enzyme [Allofrancisella guangzhouensis]AJC48442.1 hypothetical protein SD28_01635 [Allofrancisella guangzhouensis]MBK2027657.1 YggS family pyridoxal phosphate-dependent enzyme [Allofrancisella guangzhouensis]MBK2044686.1 YggS family pyridoxal phosphate-dependent enzyme [Allofrancisella guangzhouensis]MBK2046478.1 YggS family pyridoxal phosphate-dependent enzyme [Allofrancisella guangzhouensis]